MRAGRALLALALALLAALWLPLAAVAQDGGANVQPRVAEAAPAPAAEALDFEAWDRLADRAEELIEARDTTPLRFEQLRAQIVDWRTAFLAAQGANANRIITLRGQIAALGAAPAEGETEAEEIASRRRELTEQLVRLQAPVIAAEEAYSRADGLVRAIDRSLRERQAEELLRLWPAPVNPANWPAAAAAVLGVGETLVQETGARLRDPELRRGLLDALPRVIGLLALGIALLWRGRPWFEQLPNRLRERASLRAAAVWGFVASLGQIVAPVAGVVALVAAFRTTGLAGPQGDEIAQELIVVAFALFAGRWMGLQIFPRGEPPADGLRLPPPARRQGRLVATGLGFLTAAEALRGVVFSPTMTAEGAVSVLAFPGIALAGLLLWHLGSLLRRHVRADTGQGESASYRNRLIRTMGTAAMAVGVLGPLLAAVGYVTAGLGLVYPAALSLGLVGLLFLIQTFVRDLFALVTGAGDEGREALGPVLVGFLLTLAALPVFALIWGARWSDLTEVFSRLREGFAIGQTRISPTDFLTFAVVFAFGFMLTRLLQGALRSSILPKTKLDKGGQNAVTSGIGYVGIFLAALVAINSAGIDLSGLAIVAGALSVGIGFGLQNIVSNFVSGIILLIERPVSEGDWIETGGVQGRVRSISVRSTRIETFDRTDVIVPNTDLIAGRVTNWTRFNLTGRLIVPVAVAYGSDTRKVARILQEVAEEQPLAILNPPPLVTFMGFGVDAMNFEIRVILRDVNFGLSVRTEINHRIVERFAEEGIAIPFAQRDIWLRNPEALAGAVQASGPARAPAPPAPPGLMRPDPWPSDEASPEAQGETDEPAR